MYVAILVLILFLHLADKVLASALQKLTTIWEKQGRIYANNKQSWNKVQNSNLNIRKDICENN